MGYYTSYTLNISGPDEDVISFKEEMMSKSADDGELSELFETGFVDAKLYDLTDWISVIAPHYPNLQIILQGSGETSDDFWEARYKGKDWEIQYATIPPFENKNLQFTITND